MNNWESRFNHLDCPFCRSGLNHISDVCQYDNPESTIVSFLCENNHQWSLAIQEVDGLITLLIVMHRLEVDYKEYLASDDWKNKADAAKESADYRCQLCNKHKNEAVLHAHHRTYERLGAERPGDITVLCADCHAKFHDKI